MAINSDLGQQTSLQAAFNEQLKETAKIYSQIESSLGKMAGAVNAVKGGADKGIRSAAGAVQDLADSTDAAAKAAASAKNNQESFSMALQKGKEDTEAMNEALEKAAKIGAAFGDSLTGAASSTIGLVKGAGSLIGTLFNLGLAILSIPFKLWDAFVEKSMNMPYNPAFAQMREDVREMFGSLSAGAGKQVMDGYKELRSEMGAIGKEAGLSMSKVFGFGVEGRAAMLGFVKEMSQGLGSQLGPIMKQIGSDMGRVTYAIKGMGLSSEESGSAMKFFYNSGQNASQMLQDMGKTAAMMAKQSGFNIKTMSKAMVETTSTFPQFAKGGVKAMAEVAHYTHNLGIEVKDLQAVFEKFDSFDQAAESASNLSQAFGVQIDAMKMVQESSPTKRMEELRNAFKAAGKDINSMTSAERKLAEQTVGLSGAAFEAALGEGNKKKALSDSEKAAKAATQAAKDQTKAMRELADSIKRIIPPQPEKYKGFFDAFSKGFSEGMFYSENLSKMFRNLQATFRQAYWFGFKLARLLFDSFPGMDKLAKGFTDIFNPGKFSRMFDSILDEFKKFFKAIETDPKGGMRTLVENVKNIFKNMFGGSGGALDLISEGFKQIMSVLGGVIGEGIKILLEMMTEGIRTITDLILHPEKAAAAAGGAATVASSFFSPMLDAIVAAGPAFASALGDLLMTVFEKLKPYLYKAAGFLVAFFLAKFALSFGASLAWMAITEAIKKRLMASSTSALTSAVSNLNSTLQSGVGGGGLPGAGPAGGGISGTASIPVGKILLASAVIAALGVLIYHSMIPFARNLKAMINEFKSARDFVEASLGLAAILIAMGFVAKVILGGAPTSYISKYLPDGGFESDMTKLSPSQLAAGFVTLGIVALGVYAFMDKLAPSVKAFEGISFDTMIAFAGSMIAIATVIGGLSFVATAIGSIAAIPSIGPSVLMAGAAALGIIGLFVMPALVYVMKGLVEVLSEKFSKNPEGAEKIAIAVDHLSNAIKNMSISLALIPGTVVSTLTGSFGSLEKVTGVIKQDFPEIIRNIDQTIKNPDEVSKKAEIFKTVGGMIVELTKVISEFTKNMVGAMVGGFFQRGAKSSDITAMIDSVKQTVVDVAGSLKTFVEQLATGPAKSLTESEVKSVVAVTALVQTSLTMLTAILEPWNETIKYVKILADKWTGGNPDQQAEHLKATRKFLSDPDKGIPNVINQIAGGIQGFMEGMLDVIKKFKGVVSPEEISAMTKLMEVAGNSVKMVIENFQTFFTGNVAFREGTKELVVDESKIYAVKDQLETMGSAIGIFVGTFSDAIIPIIRNPKLLAGISTEEVEKKIGIIKSMIEMIPSIFEIAKAFSSNESAKGIEDAAAGVSRPVIEKIPSIAESLNKIVDALFPVGGGGFIRKVVAGMTGITVSAAQNKNFQQVAGIITSFSGLVSSLNTLTSGSFDAVKADSVIDSIISLFTPPGASGMMDVNGGAFYRLMNMLTPDLAAKLQAAPFKSVTSNLKNAGGMLEAINALPTTISIPTFSGNFDAISQVTDLVNSIHDSIGNVTTADLKKITTVTKLLSSAQEMGKIEVTHNIPGVEMVVNVHLDAQKLSAQLAPQIIRVDLNKDVTKSRTIAVTQDGPQDKTLIGS